jgi:chemotaxis signal transduction protein
MNDSTRFVTFPLGEQRYALESSQVKELLMPAQVYRFPHTMSSVEGVLVRRGRVIPVCDLRPALGHHVQCSFYVVARCNYAGRQEIIAIPVNGACQLVQGERSEAQEPVTFVAGLLHSGGQTLPLLDLDQVVAHCIQPARVLAREAKR